MGIGFSQFFSSIAELFGVIYTSGNVIYSWLVTPLIENVDSGSAELLGEFVAYSPLQLMFGPAILIVLVLALVKFILPS